jgi:hypothetical protein
MRTLKLKRKVVFAPLAGWVDQTNERDETLGTPQITWQAVKSRSKSALWRRFWLFGQLTVPLSALFGFLG